MPTLDPRTTALILIDLQDGIVAGDKGPHSAADVVARGKALAERFRAARAPVVLVHVGFTPETMPSRNVDEPRLPAEAKDAGIWTSHATERSDDGAYRRHQSTPCS